MKLNSTFLRTSLPQEVTFELFETLDSTNSEMRRRIESAASVPTLIASEFQTSGRGRTGGKSFYSPRGTGLYSTFAFPAEELESQMDFLTPLCAVAVSRAIKNVFSLDCDIKWVNDLYLHEKKICGILCERIENFVIMGIGINVKKPEFIPSDIEHVFGYLVEDAPDSSFNKLLLALFRELRALRAAKKEEILEEYRKKLFIAGRLVQATIDKTIFEGRAIGIDDNFHLIFETEKERKILSSGFVSLKIK